MFPTAFLGDICHIVKKPPTGDWTKCDQISEGYYEARVEFTQTRGAQYWHCRAKLPHVLDIGLLGRIIQNGGGVRQKIKCGNIKQGMHVRARGDHDSTTFFSLPVDKLKQLYRAYMELVCYVPWVGSPGVYLDKRAVISTEAGMAGS